MRAEIIYLAKMWVKSKRSTLMVVLTVILLAIVFMWFLSVFPTLINQQMPVNRPAIQACVTNITATPRDDKSVARQSTANTAVPYDTPEAKWLFQLDATSDWFPDGVRGDNITGYPLYIVPNIVHYILIDVNEITFVHYISIKSVFANHSPDRVIIHTNSDHIEGKYWQLLISDVNSGPKLEIKKIVKTFTVYGLNYSHDYHIYHLSDVLRNRILIEFGGIYLDRDVYVIKSLNEFRKYEMTLGIDGDCNCMGTQIQIAHKRARFLRLYLQTYQKYDSRQWYWNAGIYPTREILEKYPHLVHRMGREFGVTSRIVCELLYKQNDERWQTDYYAVHMLMRGNNIEIIVKWCFSTGLPANTHFDETSIKTSRTTFGQMARLVFYNTTDLLL